MRLAIFTETFIPQVNGVSRTLARLAKHFSNRHLVLDANCFYPSKIEILVITPECGTVPQGLPYQLHKVFGVNLPAYPELKIPIPNHIKISRIMDEFKPDIIHLASPFVMGLSGLKYAKDCNIPLVASYHTNISQYLKYYKLEVLDDLLWQFIRYIHNQCLVNYSPSKDTLNLLNMKGVKNLEIWDRGIDCKEYSPSFKDEDLKHELLDGRKKLLLYVGRIAHEKNLDILMKAIHLVNWQRNDVQLVLAGDGPLANELKANAPDNVTFVGYKHSTELVKMYASADMFVFPSTTETFGNVVLEAMASGLPVIAPSSGGIKDNLIDNYNGISCQPLCATDMANAIYRLSNDENYRLLLSKQARLYAMNKSWDEVFNRLLYSYQKVLGNCSLVDELIC
ncbi:MAG: glycosyltransferase family 4 protein [Alkaliphilus sp.]